MMYPDQLAPLLALLRHLRPLLWAAAGWPALVLLLAAFG